MQDEQTATLKNPLAENQIKNILGPLRLSKKRQSKDILFQEVKNFFQIDNIEKESTFDLLFQTLDRELQFYLKDKKNIDTLCDIFKKIYEKFLEGDIVNYKTIAYYLPVFSDSFAEAFYDSNLEDLTEKQQLFISQMVEGLAYLTGKTIHQSLLDKFSSISLISNPKKPNEICLYNKELDQPITAYLPYNSDNLDDLLDLRNILREKILKENETKSPLTYLEEGFSNYSAYRRSSEFIAAALKTQIPPIAKQVNNNNSQNFFLTKPTLLIFHRLLIVIHRRLLILSIFKTKMRWRLQKHI